MIRYISSAGKSALLRDTRSLLEYEKVSARQARDIVNGYTEPGPRMLPDVVPVPVDLDTEPRESFLAPRRIGAGSVSTTILVILVFVALCAMAAVRMG